MSYLSQSDLSFKGRDAIKEPEELSDIDISSTDLNLLEVPDTNLDKLVLKVFKDVDYFREHANVEKFMSFVLDLHNEYETFNNPFHNFTHGVNGTCCLK